MSLTILLVDADVARRAQLRAWMASVLADHPTATFKEAAEPVIARLLAQNGAQVVLWAAQQAAVAEAAAVARRALGPRPCLLMMADGLPDAAARAEAYRAGADDLMLWPSSPLEASRHVGRALQMCTLQQQVGQLAERERHLSRHDLLTGLCNREHFVDSARRALAGGQRQGTPVTLMMIVLPDLGQLNSRLGHAQTDAVIVAVAARLELELRAQDTLGRLGAARFGALLPAAGLPQAQIIGERLRSCLAGLACGPLPAGSLQVRTACVVQEQGPPQAIDAMMAQCEAQLRAAAGAQASA